MVSLTMSARGPSAFGLGDDRAPPANPQTAPGKPPSPLIGAGYVLAMQWIAFASAVLQQWACG